MMTWRKLLPRQWGNMTWYQRFESATAMVMTLLLAAVIISAVVRLAASITGGLLHGTLDPFEHRVFQTVFGELITVLIALEFSHSLQYVITGKRIMIQTKVILLIAILAVSREFIMLDINTASPMGMLALAAIALALGVVFWLLREPESRSPLMRAEHPPESRLEDTET